MAFISFVNGEHTRKALAAEHRELLARVLKIPVEPAQVEQWAEKSFAEGSNIGVDSPAAVPDDRRQLGEFELISKLGSGGMSYFALAAQLKLYDHLDQWIRRRIRMCYWKRWRHVRTRIRERIALGVQRRQAIRHGKSRKGYWRMAKSIASGVG